MSKVPEPDYKSLSQKVLTITQRQPRKWYAELHGVDFPAGIVTNLYFRLIRINPEAENYVYAVNEVAITGIVAYHQLDMSKLPMDVVTCRINELIDQKYKDYLRKEDLKREHAALKFNRAIAKLSG